MDELIASEDELASPPPPWTVAAYFAGGESLNEDMVRGLREIRTASERGGILRALAQFDPKGKRPRLFDFSGENVHERSPFPFVPTGNRSPFSSALSNHERILEPAPGGDLPAAPARLAGFVQMVGAVSADSPILLVLSGHGSGAVGEFFGYRDAGSLTLPEMARALSGASRPIDVVGMDCCNMSMVEVAFELRGCARFLVASEGYVPNHGWPYREILDELDGREPEPATVEIVRRYLAIYADYELLGVSSHCAACELGRTELLVEPLRRLTTRLTSLAAAGDELAWRPIVLAHWEAQSYKNEEYVDLADFCGRLARYVADAEIAALCEEVHRLVTEEIVLASGFTGSRFQFSTGLSAYLPWSHDDAARAGELGGRSPLAEYRELAFSRETGWGSFVEAYLRATRRRPAPVRHESMQAPAAVAVPALGARAW